MGTCQAAGGQGPGGLVCWWLRSQTHPECYEAHPAQPGAETPPCKGGAKGSPGPTLSSALPACGASPCRPSPQGPLLSRALCTLHADTHSPQCPTPNATAPFSFCLRTGRTALWALKTAATHLASLRPGPRLHAGSGPHLSITPPESPLRPRLGAKESSSSKKIMQGAAARALANTEERGEAQGGSSGGALKAR